MAAIYLLSCFQAASAGLPLNSTDPPGTASCFLVEGLREGAGSGYDGVGVVCLITGTISAPPLLCSHERVECHAFDSHTFLVVLPTRPLGCDQGGVCSFDPQLERMPPGSDREIAGGDIGSIVQCGLVKEVVEVRIGEGEFRDGEITAQGKNIVITKTYTKFGLKIFGICLWDG